MALGAVQAVKDAGRLDEVIIIGLDGQQEELDAIEAGEMSATWTYEPCGTQGFELAMKILNGEKVDAMVIPQSRRITKDNVVGQKPAF
jgi:ribose transport system substrate-binding protein